MGEQKSFVAFIDILGFKEMVDQYYSGNNNSIIEILKNAFNNARDSIQKAEREFKDGPINLRFNQFSDSVIISMNLVYDAAFLIQLTVFIQIIGAYQKELMNNKIFSRGGVALDNHYEDDTIVFSKSLVKAYSNESQIAVCPRIVIDKEIVNKIKEMKEGILSKVPQLSKLLYPQIIQDWDELYFINPFFYYAHMAIHPTTEGYNEAGIKMRAEFITEHKESYKNILKEVEANILKFDEYAIKRKYIWIRELLVWLENPSASKISFSLME